MNPGGQVMGSGRPDGRSPSLSQPEANVVTVGTRGKFLGVSDTMKDEKVEELSHFRDPRYEGPVILSLF